MKVPKILDDVRKAFVNPHWAIGVVDNYQSSDILYRNPENIYWFSPSGKYDFYADCFINDHFGEPLIFFENWSSKRGTGIISYVKVSDVLKDTKNIEQYVGTALEGDTHFSYPYLFKYNGELYMVPENFQSGNLIIYKAGKTPDVWKTASIALPDYRGIDPVVFHYGEKWWLFVTPYSSMSRTAERKLEIWYADNPLDTWTPHPQNPINYPTSIARNGGQPFIHDDVLYRPTQDCSRTYGGELAIMKITTLTPEHFLEELVKILPGHSPYENAFHTFSSCGDIAVLDGNDAKYSLRMPFYFVKYVMNIFKRKK